MRGKTTRHSAILLLVVLAMILGACSGPLPSDAKNTVLNGFDLEDKARINSAKKAEPLQEDLGMGAEEVWCVNMTFTCWSCAYGEYRTCADSRLVRRVNGAWQVTLVVTEEDEEKWKARGCKLIDGIVGG